MIYQLLEWALTILCGMLGALAGDRLMCKIKSLLSR